MSLPFQAPNWGQIRTRPRAHLSRVRVLALALSLALAAPSSAQSIPDTLFDAHVRAELDRIVSLAREAGLPTAPLINRVLQGAARRVEGTRVVGVVRAYADSMKVASSLLGAGSSESEIDAGAAALRAGVSRSHIQQIRQTRGTGQATTALIVLTDLVRRGISSADAATAVTTVAQSQPDNALLSLQSAIAREAASPTPAQLRDAVQQQLRRKPSIPFPDGSESIVRAIDPRITPAIGHRAYLALSAVNSPRTEGITPTIFEGGGTVELGKGFALSAGTIAGTNIEDSLVMQLRGGLSFVRRTSESGAMASWIGLESRPLVFGGTSRRDTLSPGLNNRLGAMRANSVALLSGASFARSLSQGFALGALVELQSDRILTRTLEPRYLEPAGPRPDTLAPIGYDEHLQSSPRFFVRSSLNAVIGGLALQGTVTRRLSSAAALGERATSSQLFTLSAEHSLGSGISLFASAASREPSTVLGVVQPGEGRFRLGARFVERRGLEPLAERDAERERWNLVLHRVAGTDSVFISLRAPEAERVWVQGDFTDWAAKSLAAGPDGRFSASFPITHGLLRFRVRLDNGPWQAPPGLAVDVDEFGGEVGVALVR